MSSRSILNAKTSSTQNHNVESESQPTYTPCWCPQSYGVKSEAAQDWFVVWSRT